MPTSYTAQDMAIALEDMRDNITAIQAETHSTHAALAHIAATLQGISHMLGKEYQLDDLMRMENLSSQKLTLDRQGRRYLYIWSPVPVPGLTATVLGINPAFSLALVAGWNPISLPNGATINGGTSTNQNVVVLLTNFILPQLMPTSVGGTVALSSPPTQTNVATDTALTFVNPIQHLTQQNNSPQNVYYNFDAPASTSTFVLAPGAQTFFDWPMSVLHVYTATAVNVNGPNGIVIAGRV